MNRAIFGLTSSQLYTAFKLAAIDDDLTGTAFIKFCTQSVATTSFNRVATTIKIIRLDEFYPILNRKIAINALDGIATGCIRMGSSAECAAFQCQTGFRHMNHIGAVISGKVSIKVTCDFTGFGRAAVLDRQVTSTVYAHESPHISHLGYQSQGLSVQVKGTGLTFESQPLIYGNTTARVMEIGGVNVSTQLNVFLLGCDRVLQFLVGVNGRPRFCRARRHRRHRQHHHEYQQDTDGALSYVCFCHRIFSFPS